MHMESRKLGAPCGLVAAASLWLFIIAFAGLAGPAQPTNPPKPTFDKTSPFYFDGTICAKRWKTIWIVQSRWAIFSFPGGQRATSFPIGTMTSA